MEVSGGDELLTMENYQPMVVIDVVKKRLGAENDLQLGAMLEISKNTISKIRHRKMAIGAAMLLAMHETSGISIKELKHLMGDTRSIRGYN